MQFIKRILLSNPSVFCSDGALTCQMTLSSSEFLHFLLPSWLNQHRAATSQGLADCKACVPFFNFFFLPWPRRWLKEAENKDSRSCLGGLLRMNPGHSNPSTSSSVSCLAACVDAILSLIHNEILCRRQNRSQIVFTRFLGGWGGYLLHNRPLSLPANFSPDLPLRVGMARNRIAWWSEEKVITVPVLLWDVGYSWRLCRENIDSFWEKKRPLTTKVQGEVA